jgi:hypothetical protein
MPWQQKSIWWYSIIYFCKWFCMLQEVQKIIYSYWLDSKILGANWPETMCVCLVVENEKNLEISD